MATARIGLHAPARLDECEITLLAADFVDALTQQPLWLDKPLALLAQRADSHLRVQRPRIGPPTAAALLTAMGAMHQDTQGQHLVKLAGLDVRVYESGSRSRKLPKISPVGPASLRHWLSHSALRLVAQEAHLPSSYARRKPQAPGNGAGQRALLAVCDKVSRMLSRLLSAPAP